DTKPTAEELEQSIMKRKCRKSKPKLGVAEFELGFDLWRGRGDVHPVDVEDEIHGTDQDQNDSGRVEPSGSHLHIGSPLYQICCGNSGILNRLVRLEKPT